MVQTGKVTAPLSKGSEVSPLTALSTLQVVEARVAGATVPARHMGQTLALPGHGVTVALLLHGTVGIAGAGCGWGEDRESTDANHKGQQHRSLGLCCQVQEPPSHTQCVWVIWTEVPSIETHAGFVDVQ